MRLTRLLGILIQSILLVGGGVLLGGGVLYALHPPAPPPVATATLPTTPPLSPGPPVLLPLPVTPVPSVAGTTTQPSPPPPPALVTRVQIPALGIDLPVLPPEQGTYFPYCNVAETLAAFGVPGQGGVTFLYAHARDGMFGPLLSAMSADEGQNLLGLLVRVYTGDDRLYVYRISRLIPHVADLGLVYAARGEQLILQTSETASRTGPKLLVVAVPVDTLLASYQEAHPVPHPVACE